MNIYRNKNKHREIIFTKRNDVAMNYKRIQLKIYICKEFQTSYLNDEKKTITATYTNDKFFGLIYLYDYKLFVLNQSQPLQSRKNWTKKNQINFFVYVKTSLEIFLNFYLMNA